MRLVSNKAGALILLAMLAVPSSGAVFAQDQVEARDDITVTGTVPSFLGLPKGPEVKGVIVSRTGDRIKVRAADGTDMVIGVTNETQVKASGGFLSGGKKLTVDALLNGLPVTVKTVQAPSGMYASQISFKNGDYKTAQMIRNGTQQQFDEQTAATEALRGRVADIDNYNIKGTTNVYFATGSWKLSPEGKNELCTVATQADGTNNALLLVVGYTDSVGDEDYNQTLSEKRASSVINYLQQYCKWKPYRMLTPTGMAESDPLADNDTEQGRQQNRRVSVNIMVSKSVDGM
ncbi:OmpA family protein [Novosphingobium sp.]|uniref:OmpA family protein n=1 Tax=Novosphingobium sp. TaxID=1874826 RepID=UPI00286CC817|nr:OmpA family protein [Novosphingobium sp.]